MAADRDRVLLHRLQQGRLGLGRGAVDLVGQDDLREDRAGLELEDPAAVGQLHDDVGADDVGGHQVGRELDAVEVQVDRVGERPHQQRLAQARHAFQQRMAADEQAGQDAVDDLVVADDDLADLGLHAFVGRAELLGAGFHRFGMGERPSTTILSFHVRKSVCTRTLFGLADSGFENEETYDY